MKKKIGIIILMIVGLAIVFVYYLSKVAPSSSSFIKKYTYPIEVKEIIGRIQKFCAEDSSLNARITDTIGTAKIGYAYYLEIEIKKSGHDFLYRLACESDMPATVPESTVKLVLAYDKINNIGGYNNSDPDVKNLVNYFETNFLGPFEKYH
jgi:hypothetical protein